MFEALYVRLGFGLEEDEKFYNLNRFRWVNCVDSHHCVLCTLKGRWQVHLVSFLFLFAGITQLWPSSLTSKLTGNSSSQWQHILPMNILAKMGILAPSAWWGTSGMYCNYAFDFLFCGDRLLSSCMYVCMYFQIHVNPRELGGWDHVHGLVKAVWIEAHHSECTISNWTQIQVIQTKEKSNKKQKCNFLALFYEFLQFYLKQAQQRTQGCRCSVHLQWDQPLCSWW